MQWSLPAGGGRHLQGDYISYQSPGYIPKPTYRDCQFLGGELFSDIPEPALWNCLLERAQYSLWSGTSDVRVCTFYGGSWDFDGAFGSHTVCDSLFYETTFNTNFSGINNHHNAYLTNQARLVPTASDDVILTSLAFVTGPAGRFCLPSNSPLINTSSVPDASAVGMFHHTTVTNSLMKETNSVLDIGFHAIATGTNGLPADLDEDGIPDHVEDANGNSVVDAGETNWRHSDSDYDGRSDLDELTDGTNPLNPASVTLVRLGHWSFNDSTLAGDDGQLPNITPLPPPVASWSGTAVSADSTHFVRYREIESNGRPNINCRNGSIRFWFKPDWTGSAAGGTGYLFYPQFVNVGKPTLDGLDGFWGLGSPDTNGISFEWQSNSNGVGNTVALAPIPFVAGRWYHLAMTYSPTSTVFFINSQPVTNLSSLDDRPGIIGTSNRMNNTAAGFYVYPPPDIRAVGFRLGSAWGNQNPALGQFDELDTFNYPLTPQQIARDFHTLPGVAMATNDFDYDGRSDFLEAYVDGTATNNAVSVAGCRLAYWRFNGSLTNLLGDALQAPIYTNGIQLAASWSSNALVIPSGSARLVYRDVETNGWPDFNARSGAVRFWFRPHWTGNGLGGDGTFLFLGHLTSETTGRWELGVTNNGSNVQFRTATNGTTTTLFNSPVAFTSNKWHQIALNYTSNSVALYVNGSLVTNRNVGVSQWPALADRANGLVIGNNHAGIRSINGDFDELETFNRQLTSTEIQRSFASVQASDNDLNGVPDMLEDPVLAEPVPFAGFPFVITGTIEAEQFDRGGEGVSYHSLGGNSVTNDYRPAAMQIITNTAALEAGFIVANLRAGEWMKYTLDVRVAQNYAVDVRAAGLGIGGVFHVEFATNATAAPYTNTGPLTVLTTNWTNIIRTLLPLRAGTNIMKVVMDTNASGGQVCQLNYISVYPSWIEGATNLSANVDVTGMTTNDSSWTAATNNAARIQAAIDSVSTPGTVTIPAGMYYVAQKLPQEAPNKDAQDNTAVYVSKPNLKIQGAGKANTTLIAHNRATTLMYLGYTPALSKLSVTNVSISDLGFEARAHSVAVAGSSGFTNCLEIGFISPSGDTDLGDLLVARSSDAVNLIRNVLITNCLFRNAAVTQFGIHSGVRDTAFRDCTFIMRDGTNGAVYFQTNATPCHTNLTVPFPWTGVSVFGRECQNLVMLNCTFNGNPGLTSVNTNFVVDASDGFFWAQAGGNWFISRSSVTNYSLEGVQFGSGPGAVTGNDFDTLISLGAAEALFAYPFWYGSPTSSTNDYAFYLVGNSISGGRSGYKGVDGTGGDPQSEADVHMSGNKLNLFPAFPIAPQGTDGVGGAIVAGMVRQGMISGNVMTNGEIGAWWVDGSSSSILLKNNFSNASYEGLRYSGTNGYQQRFLILRNVINQGSRHHLRPTWDDGRAYFFGENVFKAGTNVVNPFLTPASVPVHFR